MGAEEALCQSLEQQSLTEPGRCVLRTGCRLIHTYLHIHYLEEQVINDCSQGHGGSLRKGQSVDEHVRDLLSQSSSRNVVISNVVGMCIIYIAVLHLT